MLFEGRYRYAQLLLLAVIAIFFVIKLATLNGDLPFDQLKSSKWDYRSLWYIHHDEKLLVPDARYLFLRDKQPVSILDYQPYPWMALFGIAGPAIISLGFPLFGMSEFGLRFFFIIITSITATLFTNALLKYSKNSALGFLFAAVFIFNHHNFILERYAILEHVLTLSFVTIIWLYIVKTDYFLKRLHIICFLTGILFLVKPNFAVYSYLLLLIISLTENRGIAAFLKFSLWCVCGAVFFESLNLIALNTMGIARFRYESIFNMWKIHRGTELALPGAVFSKSPPLPAIGPAIFKKFPLIFTEWYGLKLPHRHIPFLNTAPQAILIELLCLGAFLSLIKEIKRQILPIAAFLLIYLAFSSVLFFYPKRAVSFFPLLIIVIFAVFQWFIKLICAKSRVLHRFIVTFLFAVTCIYCFHETAILNTDIHRKSSLVRMNSASFDKDLPAGSVVYAHCYPYRFLWMSRSYRIFSCDDQFMQNRQIVAWAIRNKAKYVVLTNRCPADKNFRGAPPRYHFDTVKTYETSEIESDWPDKYSVVKITR